MHAYPSIHTHKYAYIVCLCTTLSHIHVLVSHVPSCKFEGIGANVFVFSWHWRTKIEQSFLAGNESSFWMFLNRALGFQCKDSNQWKIPVDFPGSRVPEVWPLREYSAPVCTLCFGFLAFVASQRTWEAPFAKRESPLGISVRITGSKPTQGSLLGFY